MNFQDEENIQTSEEIDEEKEEKIFLFIQIAFIMIWIISYLVYFM